MSFAYTKDLDTVVGNLRMTGGTYADTSSTGGEIVTGLHQIVDFQLTPYGSSVVADAPTVNASGSKISPGINTTGQTAGTLSIICTTSTAGRWRAFGY